MRSASEKAGLVEVPLYEEPFLLAVPGTHALAAIDMDKVLLLTDGHCFRDQVLDACNASSSLRSINMRATSLETVLALVAAGEGGHLGTGLGKSARCACCIERLAETVRSCMPAKVRPVG